MSNYNHNEKNLFKCCGITDPELIKELIAFEARIRKVLFKDYPKISISKFVEEMENLLREKGLTIGITSILIGMLVNNLIIVTIDAVNKEKLSLSTETVKISDS